MKDHKDTPEEKWESIKIKTFTKGCPTKLDNIIKKGFKESVDETEKWEKLAIVLLEFDNRFKRI